MKIRVSFVHIECNGNVVYHVLEEIYGVSARANAK